MWKSRNTSKDSIQKLKDENGYLHRPSKSMDVRNVFPTLEDMLTLSRSCGYYNYLNIKFVLFKMICF